MLGVFEFFFSPARPLSLGCNMAILLVTLVSARSLAVKGFHPLRLDRRALAALRKWIGDVTSGSASMEQGPRLVGETLVSQRYASLKELKRAGDEVNQEVLSAVSRSDLEGKASLARWAISTVVLLGLGGTLIGLTQAVQRADFILKNHPDFVQAAEQISGVFDGVQVAFATTLMGIICSAVLGFMVVQLEREQEGFLREFELFTASALIPRFRTSAGLALVKASQHLSTIQETLDGTMRLIIDQMHVRGLALTTTIDKSFATLTEELRGRSLEVLAEFAQTSERVSQLLGEPTKKQPTLTESMAMLATGIEGLQTAVARVNDMIPAMSEAIAREVDQQTADLHGTMTTYTGDLRDAAHHQEQVMEAGVGRIADAMNQIDETLRVVSGREEAVEQVVRALSHIEEATSAAVGLQGDLAAQSGVSQQMLADLRSKLDHHHTELTAVLAALPNALAEAIGTRDVRKPGLAATSSVQSKAAGDARGTGAREPTPERPNLFQRWFGRGGA